jgi:hypothetical protein
MQLVTDQTYDPPILWRWLHERNKVPWSSDLRLIGLMRSNASIAAAVGFNAWQDKSVWMHVAFDSPHCLTRNLLRAAFMYPFAKCGKDAAYALVSFDNLPCANFVRKLGFVELTKTIDSWVFEMRAAACRWIGASHG